MKKNKISKSWVIRQRRDKYVRQSKLEGYRSRAVYKLKELDEKFKIVKNNLNILCYDCKFSSKGIKLNNKIKINI